MLAGCQAQYKPESEVEVEGGEEEEDEEEEEREEGMANTPTPHSNTAPLMSLWSGKVPPQLRSLLLQSSTQSAAKCTHTHTHTHTH